MTAAATPIRFIVTKIKDCPVRGEVKVIESMPLSFAASHAEKLAIEMFDAAGFYVIEELTAEELAEF